MMVLRVSRGLLSPYLFIQVFSGPPIKGVAYQPTLLLYILIVDMKVITK